LVLSIQYPEGEQETPYLSRLYHDTCKYASLRRLTICLEFDPLRPGDIIPRYALESLRSELQRLSKLEDFKFTYLEADRENGELERWSDQLTTWLLGKEDDGNVPQLSRD
jgi:hypothetical protein